MTGGTDDQTTMPPPHINVERTLAIIKPDAVHKAEEIEDIVLRSGFAILQVCPFVLVFSRSEYIYCHMYSRQK